MKKVIPLGLFIIASVLVAIFVIRNPLNDNPSLKLFNETGLGADQAGVYQVSLKATQATKGQPAAVLTEIRGKLIQFEQSPGNFVTRWSEIQHLSLQGRQAGAEELNSLVGKTSLTRADKGEGFDHYLANDFPNQWFRLQLNLLQRMFVPARQGDSPVYQRREKEEMGAHLVEYTNLDRGNHRDVKKRFIHFENTDIVVDRSHNTVHYHVSNDGRLISAKGDLAFVHNAADRDQFVISLQVELVGSQAKPVETPIEVSQLTLADESQIRLVASENDTQSLKFETAMELLPRITGSTDGADVHLIFSSLKNEIRLRPERAKEIRERILATKGRDEGAKRQLAAAFGALAQSDHAQIADMLADLASECGDVFCKDQAIVALNDHTQPTVESGKKMLELVRVQPDYDTTAAAVLAVGSIARKIGDQLPEVTDTLIEAYKKPENSTLKRSIVAAMGNHGHDQYLPVLNEVLKDKDPVVRGTAFYSYRHLQAKEVDEILTAGIENEVNASTVNEGLKAVAYRRLPSASYTRIANRIAQLKDIEDAREPTRLFMKIYERNPENVASAMAILQERSTLPTVKSAIARRLEENKTL